MSATSLHINPLPQILFSRPDATYSPAYDPWPTTRTFSAFCRRMRSNLRPLRSDKPALPFLNLVEWQQSSSNITIQPLLARLLAFVTCIPVGLHESASRKWKSVVDVSAPPCPPERTKDSSISASRTPSFCRHALRKLIFFFQADRKCTACFYSSDYE